MLRPRDSHDLRLIQTSLNLSPPAIGALAATTCSAIRSPIASFAEPAAELRIESNLELETYVVKRPAFQITPEAVSYPFIYSADDRIDLGRMLERHHPDPADRLGAWARGFVRSNPTDTLALLADLNNGVADLDLLSEPGDRRDTDPRRDAQPRLGLVPRSRRPADRGGPQPGLRRTRRDRISLQPCCRRSMPPAAIGAGTTHAWADIYLPGAGWIAYDPTNGTIGGDDLIRVAVTRDISQAVPIAGSFVGAPDDYLGMTVDVSVVSENRGRARAASRS